MLMYKLTIVYKNPILRKEEIYFKTKEIAKYYKKYYEQNNSIESLKITKTKYKNHDTKPIQK